MLTEQRLEAYAVWTFIEGHVREFSPRRSIWKIRGPKSLAQGLPWVVLPTRIGPEGAMRYSDNRLGTFEPDRVHVSSPFSFRAKRLFSTTQGKPWASTCPFAPERLSSPDVPSA